MKQSLNFRTNLKKKIDDIYFENLNNDSNEASVFGYCGPLKKLVDLEDGNNRFFSEDGRVVLRFIPGIFISSQKIGKIEFVLLFFWVVTAMLLFYYVNFGIFN